MREVTWPAASAGQALVALCEHMAVARGAGAHGPALAARAGAGSDLDALAGAFGMEVEPLQAGYRDLDRLVTASAPALLRLRDGGEERLVALLGRRGRAMRALAPGHRVVRLRIGPLREALRRGHEAAAEAMVNRLMKCAPVAPRRRKRARAALVCAMSASNCVAAGWLVRSSPGGALRPQARELALRGLLAGMLASHLVWFALWIASWWLLGAIVLQGRLEVGWLIAWGLILISMVPFRALVTVLGGRLAVRAGLLLKRRLLFGALQMAPDEVRRLGAGHLLGRVLEADVFDAMVTSGGFLALTALVELALAAVVLGLGAAGPLLVSFLLGALAATLLLGRRLLRRRRDWTSLRFDMTDDLVERMIGHRTRLAQEPLEQRHLEEDRLLARYVDLSAGMDREALRLRVLLPRAWFLAGILALGPAFVWGDPTSTALGIAIGGVLIAFRALGNLGEGLEQVIAAVIAWERIRLFWRAGSAVPRPAAPIEGPRPVSGQAFLEARGVTFRYPGRNAPVLREASLSIGMGDRMILESPSGGGKSTLAALLAGLREAESGLLHCGGLDRPSLGDGAWRRRAVLVPQFHENHLLLGSLAFNLLLGRRWPPAPEDLAEAERLCRALDLGPLLERMPSGLQEMVGETGWQLSHGERSRVFLARALLEDPDLLIVDESLAALDPPTLRRVVECLLERARTLLLIAHP